jgi:hypothetical protein
MANVTGQQGTQATFRSTPQFSQMDALMRRCIEECLSCFSVCEQTLAHCLKQGGKHVEEEHLKLLIDCAESCRMSAALMSRESQFHHRHCAMCAQICKACEESCEEFGAEPQMKACADACRSCFEACSQMGANA